MPPIERNIAAVFLVFAGLCVNQFSLPLAIAILIAAILVHRGYQMSDLRANVQNSNRVQTLASSLYSWTENAVSAFAEKCKLLTNSNNRASAQNASSPRRSDVRQDCYPDSENVFSRENLHKGDNRPRARRSNYQLPENTLPYSSVPPGRQMKSPDSVNFNDKFSSPNLRAPEKEMISPRDSPWGYSLSPQQRSPVTDVRPVQAIAGPLLASAKYNSRRNSNLYVDVSSPGFSSRLLKYSEAATHQPQYARPGQLPLVHLNKSPMPTLSPHNSRKVQVPVRLRLAPPSYDGSESRLFSRNDHQQEMEQSKSVVDVLKDISRKRFRTEDEVSEPKRHHRSDSSSSSSSSSSPAFGNEMSCEQSPSGKRPREDDSPKLQKKNKKRIHSNEIFSSLSSSRNIRVGTKRKAAENLSRSNTPSPIGKLLKKSPHPTQEGISEVGELKTSDHSLQQELVSKAKESIRKDIKAAGSRPLVSQIHSQEVVKDHKPSTSQKEDHHKEEENESKAQPVKSQHGRLFAKTLAKGTPIQGKEKRKNGGAIPWISCTTGGIDALTEEDILNDDFTNSNARLNKMLTVISSAGKTSNPSKDDMVDGNPVMPSSSKAPDSIQDAKLSASNPKNDKQGMIETSKILPEANVSSPATSIAEILTPRSIPNTSEVTLPKPEQVTTASTDVSNSTLPTVLGVFKSSSSTPSSFTTTNIKPTTDDSSNKTSVTLSQPVSSPNLTTPATPSITPSAFTLPSTTSVNVPAASQVISSNSSSSSMQSQPNASLAEASKSFVSAAAPSLFGTQQPVEKQPVTSSPSFLFGATSASNVPPSSNSKPVFSLPTSNAASAVPSASSITSPFSVTSSPIAALSSTANTVKPTTSSVTSGAFTFGAAPVVTSPSLEFPKTTSSVISFGGINPQAINVTSQQTNAPSLISVKNTTSTATDTSSKPTFSFGALPTSSAPVAATTASGGFQFQFGASTQTTVTAPKPPEAATSLKYSFDSNKESTTLSQSSSSSIAKPPTFGGGGGFSFGATSSTNPQENKALTFGSPSSINPTPAPASGGFNFSANNDQASNIQKPTFGLGAAGPSAAPSNPLTSGGFSFGMKPAESTPLSPPAPNVAAPFQFGASSNPGLSVQQQAPVLGNPFSIGGASEQKPMEERFTFGSVQSSNMTSTLQANPPTFEQTSIPSFNSQTVNPLQNPVPANSSLFRFSSTGSMGQTGMFSGGCSFGQTTATGVASPGFNFNPSGPSATTPFQFGATPSAPMFSIGSGSTAPRSRPRNRRQK